MRNLYFVMRGLSRVATFLAVFWSIGWGLDALSGWSLSAEFNRGLNFRGEVEIGRLLYGLLGSVVAACAVYILWRTGGGKPYGDELEP